MAAHEAVDGYDAAPLIPEDTFALRLVIIRKALGLTQQEAAARCDLDDGSWSNWESGAKPRGMDRVVGTIATKLGIDREWLMWGGPLRGQNRKFLTSLPAIIGQGSLLDDDLVPVEFYSRPFLAAV